MRSRVLFATIVAMAAAMVPLGAQWPAQPDKKVPLKADGTVNLEAPTPRTADGKPDLTGVWLNEWFYGGQVKQPPKALPGEPPPSTFGNIGANFPNGLPFQPWAAKMRAERKAAGSKDNPDAHCLPMGLMQFHEHPEPRKIIQTPSVIVILYEGNAGVRQIFGDVRRRPDIVLFLMLCRPPGSTLFPYTPLVLLLRRAVCEFGACGQVGGQRA